MNAIRDAYADAKTDFVNHYVSEAKSVISRIRKVSLKTPMGRKGENHFTLGSWPSAILKVIAPAILADLAFEGVGFSKTYRPDFDEVRVFLEEHASFFNLGDFDISSKNT